MVVRNVFFNESIITAGKGSEVVQYYGQLFANAKTMNNFFSLYDKDLDLVVPCTSCAKNKYKSFVKIHNPGNSSESTKRKTEEHTTPVRKPAQTHSLPLKENKGLCIGCSKKKCK